MSCEASEASCDLPENGGRRGLLRQLAVAASIGGLAGLGVLTPLDAAAVALTRGQRDDLSIDQILQRLLDGNERFRMGRAAEYDYLAQKRATVTGQYPAAIILSCIDSRAPAEIVMDIPIGDSFNARIAGNLISTEVLGSMEFACAVAGAKVVMVMGHTSCGAIKGAIDKADLGHLTGLVDRIAPAVAETQFLGERTSSNQAFVDEVAKTHVRRTIATIREQSRVLSALENQGKIRVVGSMYHLSGGRVEMLS
ncbi:carbonic anhydrase family protein [Stenotrophomonas indicatrix]|uniref:carbonic anhydrase family protein n=1 Tax=Stenotrophomonas indicatrix TaxID=2045451 RepID=UPI003008956B